jgi:molybdopterin/thiamine biosynthesis adenylyltransferase
MNNNTSHGDDDDDKSESDDDNKRKRLSKFLDDKKLECEKCIVKLKRKNKKIKIICYSLLTLSVVGQTVASIVAPMLVPPLVITGITGTTAFATALSGQLKLRGQKSKIDSKIRELNVIKNKIQFLEAINGGFSEESIEEIFQYWNHK